MFSPLINRTLLIQKHNFSQPQLRKAFFRRGDKIKSTKVKKLIAKRLISFTNSTENYENNENNENAESLINIPAESYSEVQLEENENNSKQQESSKFLKERELGLEAFGKEKSSVFNSNNNNNEENSRNKNSEEDELLCKSFANARAILQKYQSQDSLPANTNATSSKNEKNKEKSLKSLNNIEKNSEFCGFSIILGFESMRFFNKYQPNFNFNVIIMLANNQYFYRMRNNKRNSRKKPRKNKKMLHSTLSKEKFSLKSFKKSIKSKNTQKM